MFQVHRQGRQRSNMPYVIRPALSGLAPLLGTPNFVDMPTGEALDGVVVIVHEFEVVNVVLSATRTAEFREVVVVGHHSSLPVDSVLPSGCVGAVVFGLVPGFFIGSFLAFFAALFFGWLPTRCTVSFRSLPSASRQPAVLMRDKIALMLWLQSLPLFVLPSFCAISRADFPALAIASIWVYGIDFRPAFFLAVCFFAIFVLPPYAHECGSEARRYQNDSAWAIFSSPLQFGFTYFCLP